MALGAGAAGVPAARAGGSTHPCARAAWDRRALRPRPSRAAEERDGLGMGAAPGEDHDQGSERSSPRLRFHCGADDESGPPRYPRCAHPLAGAGPARRAFSRCGSVLALQHPCQARPRPHLWDDPGSGPLWRFEASTVMSDLFSAFVLTRHDRTGGPVALRGIPILISSAAAAPSRR